MKKGLSVGTRAEGVALVSVEPDVVTSVDIGATETDALILVATGGAFLAHVELENTGASPLTSLKVYRQIHQDSSRIILNHNAASFALADPQILAYATDPDAATAYTAMDPTVLAAGDKTVLTIPVDGHARIIITATGAGAILSGFVGGSV